MAEPFWERPLADLDAAEWEALCDHCGRCCLHKLEDASSGQLAFTRIACRHLDTGRARCGVYAKRLQKVAECLDVGELSDAALAWLPSSCAYRLRAADRPLPAWHPLLTGSRHAMTAAGIPVHGRVLSENHVHPDGWWEHVIRWVE